MPLNHSTAASAEVRPSAPASTMLLSVASVAYWMSISLFTSVSERVRNA